MSCSCGCPLDTSTRTLLFSLLPLFHLLPITESFYLLRVHSSDRTEQRNGGPQQLLFLHPSYNVCETWAMSALSFLSLWGLHASSSENVQESQSWSVFNSDLSTSLKAFFDYLTMFRSKLLCRTSNHSFYNVVPASLLRALQAPAILKYMQFSKHGLCLAHSRWSRIISLKNEYIHCSCTFLHTNTLTFIPLPTCGFSLRLRPRILFQQAFSAFVYISSHSCSMIRQNIQATFLCIIADVFFCFFHYYVGFFRARVHVLFTFVPPSFWRSLQLLCIAESL